MEKQLEETQAVVCFLQKWEGNDLHLLYGPKLVGFGVGFMMPPGGKYEPIDDGNPIETARREVKEESGLDCSGGRVVAKIVVTIRDTHQRFLIDVVTFERWSGILQCNDEFKWLKFLLIDEILESKLLPKEVEWMEQVIIDEKPSKVEMLCGRSREDVLEFKMSPFLL